MNSVEHGRARVFRWTHLLAAGLIQVAIAAILAAWLVARGPFGLLMSRGKIAGEDIADMGQVIAVALCLFGAIAALVAAGEAFRDERLWRRSVRIKR